MAVLAASRCCFRAMYKRNRYLASWMKSYKSNKYWPNSHCCIPFLDLLIPPPHSPKIADKLAYEEIIVWTHSSYATVTCRVWLLPRHRTPTPRAQGGPDRCWPSPGRRDAESHRPLCTWKVVQGEAKQLQLCGHLQCQKRTQGLLLEIEVLPEMLKLRYGSRCRHCLVWMQMTKSGP